jgi:hypothetical protein
MPDDGQPDEHTDRVRQWARRRSDEHAGLAVERLSDLSERLRRLSSALQRRGDDATAYLLDEAQPYLKRLSDLCESLEGPQHSQERLMTAQPPPDPARPLTPLWTVPSQPAP